MLNILGTYRITYSNGISQIKNLITDTNYYTVYKVTQDRIYELEKANKFKPTNTTKQLKKELKEMFGSEFFTNKSPLFYAMKKGYLKVLYGANKGSKLYCTFEKINN